MPLQVFPVTTDEQQQHAFAIRRTVFIMEKKFDAELQFDEYDALPNTHHFLGRDTETGKIVATARCVVFADERKGKIGRVAVLPESRGKRYGAAIMAAVESAVHDQCDKFVLSAVFDKCAFYGKCGYERMNDETYLEMDVAHCMMVKNVNA
jgi:predicted GNAT family N-acyltransferase